MSFIDLQVFCTHRVRLRCGSILPAVKPPLSGRDVSGKLY